MENATNSVLIDTAKKYLQEVVAEKGNNLKLVAKAANLNEWWVHSFSQGKIKNPSTQKIEQLLLSAGFTISVLNEIKADKDSD